MDRESVVRLETSAGRSFPPAYRDVLLLLLLAIPAAASEIWDPCRGAVPARELLQSLATGDPEAQRIAAEELDRSAYCDPDFEAAAPRIVELFSHPDPDVREVVVCLQDRQTSELALPRLRGLLADREAGVRTCAIEALAAADAGTAADFLDALGDESEEVKSAAESALRYSKLPADALGELTHALRDRSPEVRAVAAAALGQFGTRAPRDELAALLTDPENAVRLQAAETLIETATVLPEDVFRVLAEGIAGDDEDQRRRSAHVVQQLGARAKPMLEPLLEAFEAAGEEQAEELALPLALLAPAAPEARAALIAALADPARRRAALPVLSLVGGDLRETVPDLIGILESGDDPSRWQAMSLLGEIGPAAGDAVPVLIGILEDAAQADDPEQSFRAETAAETLARIGGPRTGEARTALEHLATSGAPKLRAVALEALGRLGGDHGPIVDRLLGQLAEGSEEERAAAVAALGPIFGDALSARLPALRELFSGGDPELRAAVAGILWEVLDDDPAGRLAFARELVADPDPEVRTRAVTLAGGDAWVIVKDRDLLLELLGDPDRAVRAASIRALENLGPDAREALPRLIDLLADPERDVLLATIRALRRLGPAGRDALPALEELASDADFETRLELEAALAAIAGTGEEEEEDVDLESQTPEQALLTAELRLARENRPGAAAAYEHALAGFRAGEDRTGEAQALVGLGFLAFQSGRTDEAGRWLDRARVVLSELELPGLSANVWYLLGYLSNREGRPQEAREAFERALAAFGEAGSSQGELAVLAMLAHLDFAAGKTAGAEAGHREVIRRSRLEHMAATEIQALFGLGDVQTRSATLAEAHDTLSVALVKARQQANSEWMAVALASRSVVLVQQGELDAAVDDLAQARELLGNLDNAVGVGLVGLFAAELENLRGDASGARRSAEQALDVFLRTGETSGELAARLLLARLDLEAGVHGPEIPDLVAAAESYHLLAVEAEAKLLLGMRERRRGRPQAARGAFAEARELFERMESPSGAARVGLERFHLELQSGQTDAARSTAETAAEVLGRLGHRFLQTAARKARAELDLFAGRYGEARRALLEVCGSWEANGARWPLAAALHVLGRVETRQGRLQDARRRLRRAMAVVRETGSRSARVEVLTSLGELELAAERPAAAGKRFAAARDLARDVGEPLALARALLGLGEVARRRGDLAAARQAFGEAAALSRDAGSPPAEAEVFAGLGRLALLEEDGDGGAELFGRSRGLFEQMGSVAGKARAEIGLGEALRLQGKLSEARTALRSAHRVLAEIGEPRAAAEALAALGWVETEIGDRVAPTP